MTDRLPYIFATDDEYREAEGENWSRLKQLRVSPKHYRYRIDNPEDDTSSRGMLRATHCLALTPELFDRDFHVRTAPTASVNAMVPKVHDFGTDDPAAIMIRNSLGKLARPVAVSEHRKGTNDYKAWLESVPKNAVIVTPANYSKAKDKCFELLRDVRAVLHGKTLISENDHATAQRIADAVRSDPAVREMLDAPGWDVYFEFPIVWDDPVFGVKCKAKLDILLVHWESGCAWVIDLKTVRRIDPRGMAYDAESMGYHGQIAGHYARAAAALLGPDIDAIACAIIAVEGKDPHDVGIFRFSEADMWAGRELRDSLMALRAECIAANKWPGKVPEPQYLNIPARSFGLDDEPEISMGENND